MARLPWVSEPRPIIHPPSPYFRLVSEADDGSFRPSTTVTGSGRGVGAAIIEKLAAHGASVVINYIQSSCAAEEVARKARSLGVRAIIVKADAARRDGIAHLFRVARAELGRIDIVMSSASTEHFSAGPGATGNQEETTEEDIDRVLAVNVKAQLMVAQQAHKYLEDGGRLIMISSVSAVTVSSAAAAPTTTNTTTIPPSPAPWLLKKFWHWHWLLRHWLTQQGREKGVPNHALYAASKSAVMGMTRSLAHDFGARGITVNCIAPGDTGADACATADEDTRLYEPGADGETTLQQIDAANPMTSPLGIPTFPDDVAGVVALLCAPEAKWITGQTIRVPGGAQAT